MNKARDDERSQKGSECDQDDDFFFFRGEELSSCSIARFFRAEATAAA